MKRIGLIILGSFMLLSSTVLSCPDQDWHEKMTKYIEKNDGLYIKDGNLFIVTGIIANQFINMNGQDVDKIKEDLKDLINMLNFYAEQHNLKLQTLD